MEHAVSLKLIVLNYISFFILLFVIWYVIWPKINSFLEQRQNQIKDLLKTYSDRNEEIQVLLEKVKKENEDAIARRIKFLEDAKHESEKLRQEIIDKAYFESKTMMERARQDLEKERKIMVHEIRDNVSRMVIAAVEQILNNVVDQELDKKIIVETEKAINIKGMYET